MEAEKEAKPQKQEIEYTQSNPTELYLLAEDGVTYSFILVPSKLDAQTITVTNKSLKKKELSYKESQTPFKNTLDDITKKIFIGDTIAGYEVAKQNEEVASSDSIDIVLTDIFKGAKLNIYKFQLINKLDKGVEIQERDLIPLVNKSIYRIAIYYDNDVLEIPPKSKASAIIVVANDEVK